MSYHGRLEQALPRENWRRWPWPLPICATAEERDSHFLQENLPMEQVVSSCGMYLSPILVPVNRWKRWESCWLASCQGCTAEGRFACIQWAMWGILCQFRFVKRADGSVGDGLFRSVGGYITTGFLSAGISNEGSAFCLCLPEPEIGRCFSDEVRSEWDWCSNVLSSPKTWSHPPRHTMAGSSESWFWVWLFFPMGGFVLVGPCWSALLDGSQNREMSVFTPRKTCCIGSPSAKMVCASISAWGMAIVSWGPDIICNWIQYLDSIEVHDVSLVIAETDYC